jgi:hypothetical protein
MKKLYLLSILTLTSIALIYGCSTEEENTTPPPSVVATPEPEPPAPTQYTLTVTAGEGGSVTTGGTYDEGTDVTVTATPSEGYEFVGWEGRSESSSELTISLNSDLTLEAVFGLISYNVIVNSSEGGTVSFQGGELNYGENLSLVASPRYRVYQ